MGISEIYLTEGQEYGILIYAKLRKDVLNTDSVNNKGKTLLTLFVSLLYISAFTFGGGLVIITFMKKKFVDELKWIDEQEMLDLTALAQSSPGAIAVNAAILVGWRTAGFVGMIAAVFGTIIPPIMIISVISLFYNAFASNYWVALVLNGMQAGVAAVILDVVCSMGWKIFRDKSLLRIIVMFAAFAAAFFLRVNVIFIIAAAALIGIVQAVLSRGKGEEK